MTWKPEKKTMILIRWKQESKMENENGEEILKKSFSSIRENFRLHLEHQFSPALEWRSRFETIWVKGANSFSETGVLVFSELLWKSFKSPVSGGIRWMIYDTPSYETRIYAYENDVMFYNIVPAFYGRGMQAYFNLRYKVSDKLNFFIKCSNRWEGGRTGWFSRFQIIFFW